MKNFKLLLATTAMSTMGALMANADTTISDLSGSTITIRPSIDVITPLSVTSLHEFYLGVAINPKSGAGVGINSESDTKAWTMGSVKLYNENIGYGVGQPHMGMLVSTSDLSQAQVSTVFDEWNIDLKNGDTECGSVTISNVSNLSWSAVSGQEYKSKLVYGGSFYFSGNNVPAGTCTGSTTVTIIMDSSNN